MGTHSSPLLIDAAAAARTRAATRSGEAWVRPAFDRLRADAEAALATAPFAVTQKPGRSPSRDPHDYASISTYSWPNPATPDGLPYVVRDGEKSPEREKYDVLPLRRTADAVATLGLAAFFIGDARYGRHAGRLLRTWFLDPQTRMNPHLRHAQFVPGVSQGAPHGTIDTNRFPDMLDAVLLLAGQPGWSDADAVELRQWFAQYVDWMSRDPAVQQFAQNQNNIATWLDVQIVAYALYVGSDRLAGEVIRSRAASRVAAQIEPDGRQPAELRRTLSLSYSMYNLLALFCLAQLAERVGVDLWTYRTPDGRSLRVALDFLLPFVAGERPWPYQQIYPFDSPQRGSLDPHRFVRILRVAHLKWKDDRYEQALRRMPATEVNAHRINLTLPRP